MKKQREASSVGSVPAVFSCAFSHLHFAVVMPYCALKPPYKLHGIVTADRLTDPCRLDAGIRAEKLFSFGHATGTQLFRKGSANRTTVLWAHGEALSPETAAAGGREGADAVGLVFFQQLAAAAEQAGRILEFVYALAEGEVFRVVPDFAETLFIDISEGMMPNEAFVVSQIGARRVEQTHAGRYIPIPADEAMPLFYKTTPVRTPGDGLSLPREKLRLLQALLVREKQVLVTI